MEKKDYETWFDLAQCEHGMILLHLKIVDEEGDEVIIKQEIKTEEKMDLKEMDLKEVVINDIEANAAPIEINSQ